MPWTCSVCDAEVPDDARTACPTCEKLKTSWTLGERTRTFKVSRKKFRVLRGEATLAAAPDEASYGSEHWVRATAARVLTKSAARELPKRGVWPAPADLVWVVLSPDDGQEAQATLTTVFAQQEPGEVTLPADAGADDGEGTWAAPVAFVAGEGELPEIPGVFVVDVSEEAPAGFAPSVEVSALARAAKELPTEPAGGPKQHCLPGALFAYDSAFPRPGVAAHLQGVAERANQDPGERLAIFGHTDAVGSDAFNKRLSDQRAEVIRALLVGDLEALDSSAADWSLADYQAVLRALGCDPGAIDGKTGPMTKAATRAFQEEYNAGLHHPSGAAAHAALEVDGLLGPKTHAALRDAYLVWATPQLDPARLGGPRAAGCSEFNPLGDDDAANRRVTLAFFPDGDAGSPPCTAGDAGACAVDDGGRFRCSYYRTLVGEDEEPGDPVQPFFDYGWLRETAGNVHLSALTTLPDETACAFSIHRADPANLPSDSSRSDTPPELGPALATVEGTIHGGVCHASWEAGAEDPFALEHFAAELVDDGEDLERDLDGDEDDDELYAAVTPYVFRIEADGQWGISGPPSVRLDRLVFVDRISGQGLGVRPDGSIVEFLVENGRVHAEDEVVAIEVAQHVIQVVGEAS